MVNQVSQQISSTNFNLEEDLAQLKKVVEVNAIEAVVFYTGRILEATSTFCVTQLGEKAKSNVFANIEYINDYNLLDSTTRHWAHALRRLANQFRHLLKSTEEHDGHIAIILLDVWLDWLVKESHLVESKTKSFSLLENTQNDMVKQFHWISEWLEHRDLSKLEIDNDSSLLQQPVFASVICEKLIDKKAILKASKFLKTALSYHPEDLRLNQLRGLLLSRSGRLKEAEKLLRQLLKQTPNDDETVGILAGVIKKLWQNGDQNRLAQWGKLYIKGWELSKQRNTYLGINAATYSLWSGDIETSQKIAKDIIKTYQRREKTLKEILNVSTDKMDYWDHATLAEAKLLAGLTKQAEQSYQELFTAAHFDNKPHEVPANQLKHHLAEQSIISSDLLEELAANYSAK